MSDVVYGPLVIKLFIFLYCYKNKEKYWKSDPR